MSSRNVSEVPSSRLHMLSCLNGDTAGTMSASPTTIESSIKYLKRDEKFKSEKPFKVTFDTSHIPGGQKSNHEFVDVAVLMTDVRPNMSGFTLDKNGFQFCKLPTSLSHQDFLDDEAITSRHYAEVKGFVESLFPEGSEVVILGHRVCFHNFLLLHHLPNFDRRDVREDQTFHCRALTISPFQIQ